MQFNVHAIQGRGIGSFAARCTRRIWRGLSRALKSFGAVFASIGCRLTENRENFNSVTVNVNNTAVKYTIDEKKD